MSERSEADVERPLLCPWITLDPEPVLMYANARGHVVKLRLDRVRLARLGLSIAEAQAGMVRSDLNDAVQGAEAQASTM